MASHEKVTPEDDKVALLEGAIRTTSFVEISSTMSISSQEIKHSNNKIKKYLLRWNLVIMNRQ
ncbi:hypothetical protein D3C87_1549790 [compost metagenome]